MKVVVAILLIAAMFVVSARAQNRSTGRYQISRMV